MVGLRRPSVIRASGHTWEWTGYLNYDTAFPTFQGEPLDQDFALGKIIVESRGGKVYATGMNEEGSFYIGTTVFDLRTGEQFAIPLEADNEPGSVTNQVFNSVVIRSLLAMDDGSSLFFGNDSAIYFDPTTTFNTTTGPITASQTPLPEVYATTSKAGFVQLADDSVVRGALGAGGKGVADKTAVTAASLAKELNIRIDNVISEGNGISVAPSLVELPGGDPNDASDDVLSYAVSAGLPGSTDDVAFNGLRLGTVTGHYVNSITNAISLTDSTSVRQTRLVTEQSLFTSSWVGDGQLVNDSISFSKLNSGSYRTSTEGIRMNSASDTQLVTEKAVVDYMKAQPLVLIMPRGEDGGGDATSSPVSNAIVNLVANASLYPTGQVLKLVRRSLRSDSYTAPTLSVSRGTIGNAWIVTDVSLTSGSFSANFLTNTDDIVWTYINNGTQFVRE